MKPSRIKYGPVQRVSGILYGPWPGLHFHYEAVLPTVLGGGSGLWVQCGRDDDPAVSVRLEGES